MFSPQNFYDMNWGHGLTITFIAFAALIGTLVYKSVTTRCDLVTKDYYKEELEYQNRIDAIKNANALSPAHIEQNNNAVTIQLPKETLDSAQGEIWFYCKSDERKDKKFVLHPNQNGEQTIYKNQLFKENYIVKISWNAQQTPYYTEQTIFIY